jgi:hypothetical protein
MTLNVLVLESEPGAAGTAEFELERAGHRVLFCHEPGRPAFPCNAIAEHGKCPLDTVPIDVALDVRPRPRSQPAPREDGVTCAIRRHVPLVVAGPAALNPYDGYATEVLDRSYDVVGACERAAAAPLPEHTAAANGAMHEVLVRRALTAAPDVAVLRRHGRLVIEVTGAGALEPPVRSVAAVRMTGAVRAVDPDADGIDVVYAPA